MRHSNIPLNAPISPRNEWLEGRVVCLSHISLAINPQLNTLWRFNRANCFLRFQLTNNKFRGSYPLTRHPKPLLRVQKWRVFNKQSVFYQFSKHLERPSTNVVWLQRRIKRLAPQPLILERQLSSGSATMENKILGRSLEYWINTIITTCMSLVDSHTGRRVSKCYQCSGKVFM